MRETCKSRLYLSVKTAHHGFRQRGTYAPLDFVIPSLGFGGGNERPNAAVKLVAEVPVVGLLF